MSEGQFSDKLATSWKGSGALTSPQLAPKRQKSTMSADSEKLEKQVQEKKKEKLIQAEGVETGKVSLAEQVEIYRSNCTSFVKGTLSNYMRLYGIGKTLRY